ncbi:MAG: PepSY domain-containing protein [Phycisphaerales bacterium]|nr:PepSY domain-containing protein [Phycisphaerales bacterium]
MKPRKLMYLTHRWLGAIIALQLLAWSVGGFVFSILDINDVRGTSDARAQTHEPLTPQSMASLPESLSAMLVDPSQPRVASLTLIDRGLGAHWEARDAGGVLVYRMLPDGTPAGQITQSQAEQIALHDFLPESSVARSQLIVEDPPMEYRGGMLPAYRVELDHPKHPHIYISATNGQIIARRNDQWRAFDFFWMLHTMDYSGRDDFNHPLLTIASVLAILTALAGLSLWVWRFIPRKNRTPRTLEATP